jgi:hypothetical protein
MQRSEDRLWPDGAAGGRLPPRRRPPARREPLPSQARVGFPAPQFTRDSDLFQIVDCPDICIQVILQLNP